MSDKSNKSDDKSKKRDDSQKAGPSKPYDPALDVTSKHFDPLKALRSDDVILPVPNARAFDNIAKFESMYKKFDFTKMSISEVKSKPVKKEEPSNISFASVRRFLPHQEPVRAEPRKEKSNMLKKMKEPIAGPLDALRKCLQPGATITVGHNARPPAETTVIVKGLLNSTTQNSGRSTGLEPVRAEPRKEKSNMLKKMKEPIAGPLDALRKCLQPGATITIHTRRAHEVRGTLTGTLQAFDKHWNIALSNATERWSRRKSNKMKAPPMSAGCPSNKPNKIRVKIPETKIISSKGKNEVCERFVPKVMIRGEHVVLIILNLQEKVKK
ncbi:U7 snRNA-associated Sm-like protein LSm11 [Ctenocephalides felis]|uniref:U7 snRNA-associated Sm-like protein LSm11 n=1 Tax=Ctenocephalides felis TaxID=7515 RepID=UPI000E6E2A44|nr:U7 snRNA-associated Sm-like protein LSm11 [Ctenocephalides felis]